MQEKNKVRFYGKLTGRSRGSKKDQSFPKFMVRHIYIINELLRVFLNDTELKIQQDFEGYCEASLHKNAHF